ncbi:di-heme oxidoredictase family protein [Comamonas endophytica]|uniref:C-type cytochrome n=1 Tax=Comamonas endophytica TaxID=2949090 RepID=A0ABY6G8X2_9BURK|nr:MULTISPECIES: di-heme oxidoredictase family protein [unclassified Acidovorax]MCD2511787.1 c-type cytochrome [Acidovorax sp. D4N7]UYG51511.1 c-type cytochrome [Acidovorax sp. 5MLIR]
MKKSTGGLLLACSLAAALAAQVLAQPKTEAAAATAAAPIAATPAEHLPGGNTTVYATGRNAFSFPAANLSDAERTRFVIGNSFFKRNWVQAPASTTARDGLGPHFLARSCGGCHVQDGRAQPPDFHNGLAPRNVAGLLMRVSVPGKNPLGGPALEPTYGDQLNDQAVDGVRAEGRLHIRYETIKGKFADGTPYELEKPIYSVRELGYGPLAPDAQFSPRIAPQVIGLGLLEAIPAAELEANARAQEAAGGPVRGKVNLVWDSYANAMLPGRFGWKANVASLAHQTASAFQGDIGITSRLFPNESCTAPQKDCLEAPRGAKGQAVEIDDKTLDDVIFYQSTLAPPARRDPTDPQVLQGQKIFERAQCAACHRPSYVTGEPLFPRLSSPALSGQVIFPYTDMLLHDMGPDLADGRPDFLADGNQWRTPPLWGLGLIKAVNGHSRLLHDGRARDMLEAVLWHGGEASASRDAVLQLNAQERDALVRFLESL